MIKLIISVVLILSAGIFCFFNLLAFSAFFKGVLWLGILHYAITSCGVILIYKKIDKYIWRK